MILKICIIVDDDAMLLDTGRECLERGLPLRIALRG